MTIRGQLEQIKNNRDHSLKSQEHVRAFMEIHTVHGLGSHTPSSTITNQIREHS